MGIDRRFWRGKRVFLTGHTGFKGSWLSAWLQELDADVHGFALDPPTDPGLFSLASIGHGMTDTRGDVRDGSSLAAALRASGAQIVIHMAAQSLVRQSWEDPAETWSTNVQGTLNLLDEIRGAGSVGAVLVVTSDKVYANDESGRLYGENDRLGGSDPYSASKACQDLVAMSYRKCWPEQFPGLATARSGNVIGGGDWAPGRLLPDAVQAFVNGSRLQVRYPRSVRPWQHVLDPLAGYLMLVQRLFESGEEYSGGWNFGPGADDMRSVAEVVDEFKQRWGGQAGWEQGPGASLPEAGLLRLDSNKARRQLGWRSRLPLGEGLDWTFDWYRQWADGADLGQLTRRQLQSYAGLGEEG